MKRIDRYLLLLVGLMGAYVLIFFSLDFASEHVAERYIIHCALDDLIPFNEWFAIPYFLWFLAFPGGLLAFWRLDKGDFLELCFVIFGGAAVSFCVYLLWPNGLALRPELAADNLAGRMLALVWLVDAPNNVCPSLHVSISVAIGLVCWRARRLKAHLGLRLGVWGLMLLICVSTLFVKQHSVIDVAAGAALSLILYGLAELWRRRDERKTYFISRK